MRLVAATHQDLRARVEDGTFRENLYYRLKVHVPPLRELKEDIRELANYFLASLSKTHGVDVRSIEAETLARMEAYDWPGNVLELRNAIEHAIIMARGDTITEVDLPTEIVPENRPKSMRAIKTGNADEREKLLAAL